MSLFSAWNAAIYYESASKELMRKLRPANTRDPRGEKCVQCGYCCWFRPCSVSPEDIARISKYLGISEVEFFRRYLTVDSFSDSDEERFKLIIARRKGSKGRYLTDEESWDISSPCVFLEESLSSLGVSKCKIHNVKPLHGSSYICCVEKKELGFQEYRYTKEDLNKLGWDGHIPDCGGVFDD